MASEVIDFEKDSLEAVAAAAQDFGYHPFFWMGCNGVRPLAFES